MHTLFGLGSRRGAATAIPEILPGGELRTRTTAAEVIPLLRAWTTVEANPAAVDGDAVGLPAGGTWRTASWLVPWPQVVLLLVLAALVAGWLAGRRRRRRPAAAPRDAGRRGRDRATVS
ncbi:hypothetical protein [Plantactinospora sp. KBS50]|uniref:hypothetical protein n=1 Tax=Plantactinospora sp. KBS50 TaxID=2024580 RepID=UPI001E51B7A3|nr:hypothetical protein [Plantactinospora sp. KBS50]